MDCFVLLALTALLAVAEGVCHSNERHYYEGLGCVPQDTDQDGCVTSYDCSSLAARKEDRCYYKGQEYPEGATISSPDYYTCFDHCTCVNSTTHSRFLFECVRVKCPELQEPIPDKYCYKVHEHGQCCAAQIVCNNSSDRGEIGCWANRRIYNYGQKFIPDEDQCLACICNQEFNGSFVEPFCRRLSCNLELMAAEHLAKGCIPIYYGENACCPVQWRCPNSTDAVVPSATASPQPSDSSTARTCKFGELTMQVGDGLNDNPKHRFVNCSCRVPPHPTCVIPEADFKV